MLTLKDRTQELCESGGGRPGLPIPKSPYSLCRHKETLHCSISELGNCVKVEVAVLGSPSLNHLTVSVDIKKHCTVVSQNSGNCVKVKVAVLDFPSLIVCNMVSVDVKQH